MSSSIGKQTSLQFANNFLCIKDNGFPGFQFTKPENLPKTPPNGTVQSKGHILAVFGQFLGLVTSDLFLDCCIETVVQMRFF